MSGSALHFISRRWKPTPVLDQAAQTFDLAGVAGVAVDDAGEPDPWGGQRLVLGSFSTRARVPAFGNPEPWALAPKHSSTLASFANWKVPASSSSSVIIRWSGLRSYSLSAPFNRMGRLTQIFRYVKLARPYERGD